MVTLMTIGDLKSALIGCYKLARTIACLPVAQLQFDTRLDPVRIPEEFRNYTKPHPRYKVFRNKTLGAALIDLRRFADPEHYFASVNEKGCAGPQSRKASARGYQLREIERSAFADQIHDINISSEERQGRPMDAHYTVRQSHFEKLDNYRYFGVTDADGKLVAYCNVGIFGNFAATHQLLGYRNNHGIMYLLLAAIIQQLIREGLVEYFMYDTMLGGSNGLRDFKRRVGFTPYRASYSLQR